MAEEPEEGAGEQADPYGDRLREFLHSWADECWPDTNPHAIRHALECLTCDVIEAAVEVGIAPKDLFAGAMAVRRQRVDEGFTPRDWWSTWKAANPDRATAKGGDS
jgi:hypothetical protein